VVAAAYILDRLYGRPAQATDLALKAEAIDVSALISPRWLRRQDWTIRLPVRMAESKVCTVAPTACGPGHAVLLNMAHLKHQSRDNAPATSILAVRRSVQIGPNPRLKCAGKRAGSVPVLLTLPK
jgi:hypothetical protein